MNKLSKEEKERLKKINDTFLYNVGYEHVNNLCDETDKLLDESNDIEVPDSLNQWFIDYNKELKRKDKTRKIQKKAIKYTKRIATVLIIISIAGSVVTMSVEAFRVHFFNMVIETSQKFSLVSYEEQNETSLIDELPNDWSDYYYPAYLPEEYKLVSAMELNSTIHMIFKDSGVREIRFSQSNITSESQLDTENAQVMNIDINGNEGIISEKDGFYIITWNNNSMSFYLQGNIDKSTLLNIAESIQKEN